MAALQLVWERLAKLTPSDRERFLQSTESRLQTPDVRELTRFREMFRKRFYEGQPIDGRSDAE